MYAWPRWYAAGSQEAMAEPDGGRRQGASRARATGSNKRTARARRWIHYAEMCQHAHLRAHSRERIEEGAQRPHDALLPPRVTHLVALALDDRGAHLASVGLGWAALQGCVGTCGDVKGYAGVYRGV